MSSVTNMITFNFFVRQSVKTKPKYPQILNIIENNLFDIVKTFINCWKLHEH